MIQGVPQPAFYIFKCQQSAPPGMPKPSCVSQNDPESQQLFQHLAQSLMMKGIIGTVQPIQTGCDEHIIGGKVVEEYVIPEEMWGEPIPPSQMAR